MGISSLGRNLDVSVARAEQIVPIEHEVAFEGQFAPVVLNSRESARAIITVRTQDRSPFGPGDYAVTFDIRRFAGALMTERGSPWLGRIEKQTTRRVTISAISGNDDRATWHELEANAFLGAGRANDAIPHLEQLVRLRSTAWHPHASLGSAYLKVGRFAEAALAFERAMPGWARVRRQVGDIVPNSLASA